MVRRRRPDYCRRLITPSRGSRRKNRLSSCKPWWWTASEYILLALNHHIWSSTMKKTTCLFICMQLAMLAQGPEGDGDADGVPDAQDLCQSTPRGSIPIASGCS